MAITVGTKGFAEAPVRQEDTAQHVGSGELPVYATPCLAALMEQAAYRSIAPFLAEGESSVGTELRLTHSAATPVGLSVRAESVVTAVEGRRVSFSIVAYDEAGEIGRAAHERCIIRADRFLEKAYKKL